MSSTRYTFSSRSTKRTTLYTPYFRKPLWACSPDADTLAPPIFDAAIKTTGSTKVSEQKALGITGMEDPIAHSRAPRSYVHITHLVQETAVSTHDAKACSIMPELQKQGLSPFGAASFSRVAQGSSGSSSGSATSNSLSDMGIASQRPTHARNFSDGTAAGNSAPRVPPGLGYDVLLASPRCFSQVASLGVIGDRSGADDIFAPHGLDRIAGVTSPPVIPEPRGSCAIPCVLAPKSLELKSIAYAFSDLSAHFMYSLAIQAGADEFFPDP